MVGRTCDDESKRKWIVYSETIRIDFLCEKLLSFDFRAGDRRVTEWKADK